jgi:hypothetical protein
MFNLGDKVRWQVRNKNATGRWAPSFYLYEGVVIGNGVKGPIVKYTTAGRNEQGKDCAVVRNAEFRQLRNSKFIEVNQTHDDPKGRLYLTHDYSEEVAS